MFNFIGGFLENRRIQVRVGSNLSISKEVENGVPQGSVISPILFLIAINDLKPPGVSVSMFADDTAIWKGDKHVGRLQIVIQRALDYIHNWCNLWGFKISIAKTSFVLFKRGKGKKVDLNFGGQALCSEKKVKFLGLLFDYKLTWKAHIDYVVDKCNKRINILKALSGTKWGADKETMVLVYRSLIRSCMDYGSEVYDSACKTNKLKLDRIQSQALRLCSGALRCTSVAALQVDCGELPLDLQRLRGQVRCAVKAMAFPSHPVFQSFQEYGGSKIGSKEFRPIVDKIGEMLQAVPNIVSEKWPVIPSWEFDWPDIVIDINKEVSKKRDSPQFMLTVVNEFMEKWSQHLKIYTDGSKVDEKTGCAFWIPHFKLGHTYRISNGSSVL